MRELHINATWVEIANYIQGKNPKQCSYRYTKLTGKSRYIRNWTREEDFKLIEMVEHLGENFVAIKSYFPNKAMKDLRCRYYKRLGSKLADFNLEDDYYLMQLYRGNEIDKECLNKLLLKGVLSLKRRLEYLVGENACKINELIHLFLNELDNNINKEENESQEPQAGSRIETLGELSLAFTNEISVVNENKSKKCKDDPAEVLTYQIQDTKSSNSRYVNKCFDFKFDNIPSIVTDNNFNIPINSNESLIGCYEEVSCNYFRNYVGMDTCMEEFTGKEELRMKQAQINSLIEKKKSLEEILLTIQVLSESFFKDIESSKQPGSFKTELLNTIENEIQQLHKLSSLNLACNLKENPMIKGLLTSIEILIGLINLIKEKISIVRRIIEN